jgi:hypothetical protein
MIVDLFLYVLTMVSVPYSEKMHLYAVAHFARGYQLLVPFQSAGRPAGHSILHLSLPHVSRKRHRAPASLNGGPSAACRPRASPRPRWEVGLRAGVLHVSHPSLGGVHLCI